MQRAHSVDWRPDFASAQQPRWRLCEGRGLGLAAARSMDSRRDEAPDYLKGVRLSLNVLNVLGRDPPRVLSTNTGGASSGSSLAAYDTQNANSYGRIYEMRIAKKF